MFPNNHHVKVIAFVQLPGTLQQWPFCCADRRVVRDLVALLPPPPSDTSRCTGPTAPCNLLAPSTGSCWPDHGGFNAQDASGFNGRALLSPRGRRKRLEAPLVHIPLCLLAQAHAAIALHDTSSSSCLSHAACFRTDLQQLRRAQGLGALVALAALAALALAALAAPAAPAAPVALVAPESPALELELEALASPIQRLMAASGRPTPSPPRAAKRRSLTHASPPKPVPAARRTAASSSTHLPSHIVVVKTHGIPFWLVGAPSILVPVLVGIGIGYGILTHGHMTLAPY